MRHTKQRISFLNSVSFTKSALGNIRSLFFEPEPNSCILYTSDVCLVLVRRLYDSGESNYLFEDIKLLINQYFPYSKFNKSAISASSSSSSSIDSFL